MFVKQVDLPVDERAQEVAFTKLNDAFWVESTGKSRRLSVFTMGSFFD
jgi:hypothetical protein